MSRIAIQHALRRSHDWYFHLLVGQRLYINAAAALVVFLVSWAVMGAGNSRGPLLLFLAFWCGAICYDLIALYKRVSESVLGKAICLIIFSLCTSIAIVLSNQAVNSVVAMDPAKFPHTVAFLSILTIPFFIVAGFAVLYFLLLLAGPFLMMFHLLVDEQARRVLIPGYSVNSTIPYEKTTRLVQFISFIFFCGFLFSLSQRFSSTYDLFMADTAKSFLYHFEMYSKAPCPLDPNTRAAFIGDDTILVATKNEAGMAFHQRECVDDST